MSFSTNSLLGTNGILAKILNQNDQNQSEYKIQYDKLEIFLQSIVQQVNEIKQSNAIHDQIIQEQQSKRIEEENKLNNSFIEINLLKDTIYSDEVNSDPLTRKFDLLKGEFEGIKQLVKKIEFYQVEQINVFNRLRKVENNQYMLEKFISASQQENIIIKQMQSEISTLKDLQNEYQENNDVRMQELLMKLKDSDDKLQSMEEALKEMDDDDEEEDDNDENDAIDEETNEDLEEADDGQRSTARTNLSSNEGFNFHRLERNNSASNRSQLKRLDSNSSLESSHFYEGNKEQQSIPIQQYARPSLILTRNPIILESDQRNLEIEDSQESGRHSAVSSASDSNHTHEENIDEKEKQQSLQKSNSKKNLFLNSISENRVLSHRNTVALTKSNSFGSKSQNPLNSPSLDRQVSTSTPPKARRSNTFVDSKNSRATINNSTNKLFEFKRRNSSVKAIKSLETIREELHTKIESLTQEYQLTKHNVETINYQVKHLTTMTLKERLTTYYLNNIKEKKEKAFEKIKLFSQFQKKLYDAKQEEMKEKLITKLKGIRNKCESFYLFQQWKANAHRIKMGAKMNLWIKSKVTIWMNKAVPDIRTYLNKWKSFILNSYRVKMLQSDDSGDEDLDPMERQSSVLRANEVPINSMVLDGSPYRNTRQSIIQPLPMSTNSQVDTELNMDTIKEAAYYDLKKRMALQTKKQKEQEKINHITHTFQLQIDQFQEKLNSDQLQFQQTQIDQFNKQQFSIEFLSKEVAKVIKLQDDNTITYNKQVELINQQLSQGIQQNRNAIHTQKNLISDRFFDVNHVIKLFKEDYYKTNERNQQLFDQINESLVNHESILDQRYEEFIQLKLLHEELQQKLLLFYNQLQEYQEELQLFHLNLSDLRLNQEKLTSNSQEISSFYQDEMKWLKTITHELHATQLQIKESCNSYEKQILSLFANEGSNEFYNHLLWEFEKDYNYFITWIQNLSNLYSQSKTSDASNASNQIHGSNNPPSSNHVTKSLEVLTEQQKKLSYEMGKLARRFANYISIQADQDLLKAFIQDRLMKIPNKQIVVEFDTTQFFPGQTTNSSNFSDKKMDKNLNKNSNKSVEENRLNLLGNISNDLLVILFKRERKAVNRPSSASSTKNDESKELESQYIDTKSRKEKFHKEFIKLIEISLNAFPSLHSLNNNRNKESFLTTNAPLNNSEKCMACFRPLSTNNNINDQMDQTNFNDTLQTPRKSLRRPLSASNIHHRSSEIDKANAILLMHSSSSVPELITNSTLQQPPRSMFSINSRDHDRVLYSSPSVEQLSDQVMQHEENTNNNISLNPQLSVILEEKDLHEKSLASVDVSDNIKDSEAKIINVNITTNQDHSQNQPDEFLDDFDRAFYQDLDTIDPSTESQDGILMQTTVSPYILANTLAERFPKDCSIRPKHLEPTIDQVPVNFLGLEARKIKGVKEK